MTDWITKLIQKSGKNRDRLDRIRIYHAILRKNIPGYEYNFYHVLKQRNPESRYLEILDSQSSLRGFYKVCDNVVEDFMSNYESLVILKTSSYSDILQKYTTRKWGVIGICNRQPKENPDGTYTCPCDPIIDDSKKVYKSKPMCKPRFQLSSSKNTFSISRQCQTFEKFLEKSDISSVDSLLHGMRKSDRKVRITEWRNSLYRVFTDRTTRRYIWSWFELLDRDSTGVLDFNLVLELVRAIQILLIVSREYNSSRVQNRSDYYAMSRYCDNNIERMSLVGPQWKIGDSGFKESLTSRSPLKISSGLEAHPIYKYISDSQLIRESSPFTSQSQKKALSIIWNYRCVYWYFERLVVPQFKILNHRNPQWDIYLEYMSDYYRYDPKKDTRHSKTKSKKDTKKNTTKKGTTHKTPTIREKDAAARAIQRGVRARKIRNERKTAAEKIQRQIRKKQTRKGMSRKRYNILDKASDIGKTYKKPKLPSAETLVAPLAPAPPRGPAPLSTKILVKNCREIIRNKPSMTEAVKEITTLHPTIDKSKAEKLYYAVIKIDKGPPGRTLHKLDDKNPLEIASKLEKILLRKNQAATKIQRHARGLKVRQTHRRKKTATNSPRPNIPLKSQKGPPLGISTKSLVRNCREIISNKPSMTEAVKEITTLHPTIDKSKAEKLYYAVLKTDKGPPGRIRKLDDKDPAEIASKLEKILLHKKVQAATKIQRQVRDRKARQKKKAATRIQRQVRGFKTRKNIQTVLRKKPIQIIKQKAKSDNKIKKNPKLRRVKSDPLKLPQSLENISSNAGLTFDSNRYRSNLAKQFSSFNRFLQNSIFKKP